MYDETNIDSDGTLTPIPAKSRLSIEESIISDDSMQKIETPSQLNKLMQRKHETSVSDNEYFTAQSEFAESSSASSSNWKKD